MTLEEIEELLPCPFCGGRAEIKVGVRTKYMMCLKCEVMGPNLASDAELITAWNRRDLTARGLQEGFEERWKLNWQVAFEAGYKACERGENLQAAFASISQAPLPPAPREAPEKGGTK